jgi:hypothetical protein
MLDVILLGLSAVLQLLIAIYTVDISVRDNRNGMLQLSAYSVLFRSALQFGSAIMPTQLKKTFHVR